VSKNLNTEIINAEIVRPLLSFRRAELRNYLGTRGEAWREDSSNDDPSFTRNRIRHRLLPLIAEEFGDAAIEHMAELAEIARAEEEHSAEEFNAAESSDPSLDAKKLLACPLAIQRRLVRGWLETNAPEASISFALIEEILQLARGDAGQKIELPGSGSGNASGNWSRNVRRGRAEIVIEAAASSSAEQYEYTLHAPGAVDVPEIGARFEARIVETASLAEGQAAALLDPAEVGERLTIRNWRPGDRYWPAHTAREKKVKELLADLHATGAKKKLWPVAVDSQGRIVWMRGFAAPEALGPRTGKSIWICEIAPDS
jgi:tRNA(Ile)-lysidine synthase